jgi:MFS family permease
VKRLSHRGIFLALGVQVFLLMLGVGIVAPVLPLYAREFGVSVTAVGFLITVFGIARIGTDVPTGHLAERIGRRPLLVGGALAVAVGSFGFALAGTYVELVGWRFLQGVGSAATTTAAAIAVSELAAPEERGRALSLYQGTLLLGAGAGPVVGGFVAEGFGFRAPFYLLGGLALAAALWAIRLPETRPAPARHPAASRAEVPPAPNAAAPPESIWRSPEFWLVSLFTLTVFASRSGGQGTLLPLFGFDRLRLDESAIGLAFTVLMAFNVGAIYLSGMLSDHFGRKSAIVPGGLLTGAALALLPLSPNTAVFLGLCALFGLGIGIAGPAPAAFIADIAPPQRLASTMGSYRMIADLGLMGGPVIFGWVAESFGYGSGFLVNAAAIGLAAVAIGVGARESR